MLGMFYFRVNTSRGGGDLGLLYFIFVATLAEEGRNIQLWLGGVNGITITDTNNQTNQFD